MPAATLDSDMNPDEECWRAALRCVAALGQHTEQATELGGWTAGACMALALICWAKLEEPRKASKCFRLLGGAPIESRDAAVMLCAAVIAGPLTRLCVTEHGTGYHWYWRSLFGQPRTGKALLSTKTDAVAFLVEQTDGALGTQDAVRAVEIARAAANYLVHQLHQGTATATVDADATGPPPAQVRTVADGIMAVECLFGPLRAARWAVATGTPLSCWSQKLDSDAGARDALAAAEPLSLFSLLRGWLVPVASETRLRIGLGVASSGATDCLLLLQAAGKGNRLAVRAAIGALLLHADLSWANLVSMLPAALFGRGCEDLRAWPKGFNLDLPAEWKSLSADL